MKLSKNRILGSGAVLFVLNMLASVLNYICQLAMARVLSVESFGTVNIIFSFLLVIGVPGTTLTMVAAKYYAELEIDAEQELRVGFIVKVIRYISILAVMVFIVCIIFIKPISNILSIKNIYVLLYAFILGALSFYQPLYSGVFSGNSCFVLVGIYSLCIPIYKIVSVIAAAFYTNDDLLRLYVVLFVMVLGTILTALAGNWQAAKIVGRFSVKKKVVFRIQYNLNDINTLVMNVCLVIYMNIDLLVVRYFGDDKESGLYSSVLLFGRVIYYFSTTLGTILLPMAVASKNKKSQQIKLLNRTIGIMIIFILLCNVPFNVLGKIFIQFLYGNHYLEAQKYVKYISLISAALSINSILVNYLVGIGKTRFVTVFMLIINSVIGILISLNSNIEIILMGIGVSGLAGAILIYAVTIFQVRKNEIEKE